MYNHVNAVGGRLVLPYIKPRFVYEIWYDIHIFCAILIAQN